MILYKDAIYILSNAKNEKRNKCGTQVKILDNFEEKDLQNKIWFEKKKKEKKIKILSKKPNMF